MRKIAHVISPALHAAVFQFGDLVIQQFLHKVGDPESTYVYSDAPRLFYHFHGSTNLILKDERVPKHATPYHAFTYYEPELVEYMLAESRGAADEVDEHGIPGFMVRPCNSYRILQSGDYIRMFLSEHLGHDVTVSKTSNVTGVVVEVSGLDFHIELKELQQGIQPIGIDNLEFLALAIYLDANSVTPTNFAEGIRL